MIKTLQAAQKQERMKMKLPKSVQQAVPIQRIWQDGTFQFGSKFSQTVRFSDINYAIASKADKTQMFLGYGKARMSNRSAEMSGVLLIKEATKKGYKEAAPGDSVKLSYTRGNTKRGRVGKAVAHTLDTSCSQGIVAGGGRIRRLMPRECLRLQGFAEDQIDRLLAITSDAQAYKQAGNSVTVNVIEVIGRNLKAVHEELRGGA